MFGTIHSNESNNNDSEITNTRVHDESNNNIETNFHLQLSYGSDEDHEIISLLACSGPLPGFKVKINSYKNEDNELVIIIENLLA